MDIKIEKGVIMPPTAKAYTPRRGKYPLKDMTPGDSFFVPQEDKKKMVSIRAGIMARAKKMGITISTLADETGVRVWRTR